MDILFDSGNIKNAMIVIIYLLYDCNNILK